MALSVVLVSYNCREELENFFPPTYERIRAEVPDAEFVVVDNASTDDGPGFLRGRFPDVTVRALDGNRYFGPAANEGVALAHHELVLLLNPDVEVARLEFARVAAEFAAGPRLFSLHPEISDPRDSSVERLFWLGMRRGLVDVALPRGFPDGEEAEIPFATGGAVFLRRSVFLDLGGFDPLFSPFYWEDVDLGVRAIRAGFTNRYLPGPSFLHRHSTIIRRHHCEAEVRAIYERNRLRFQFKHLSWFSRPHLQFALFLGPRLVASLARDRSFWRGWHAFAGSLRPLFAARRNLWARRFPVAFAEVLARFRKYDPHG